jgi:glycosyltransferase involved in cell wall biosynthesis
MSKPTVTIFRDFLGDNRTSMEVYANELICTLNNGFKDRFDIREFTPQPFFSNIKSLQGKLGMRFNRYLSYPVQAYKNQTSVNHIIDHTYGHLLRCINPQRTLVTVHDLIPILAHKGRIPGMSYPNVPLLFKFSISALKKAQFVVTVSENTKRDLIAYCGLPEEKIRVIYNGISEKFKSYGIDEKKKCRNNFGLPDKEECYVVLITGSLQYKNHTTSFKVVEMLQQKLSKPVQLVILKGKANLFEVDFSKYNFTNPPLILSGLDNCRIVELYNAVDCLLFPSLYEGFGWPPLEAMACGTPVVSSNVASLPEIIDQAGLMASPYDTIKLTEAAASLLENKELREEYVKKGLSQASKFSWSRCASEFEELYTQLLNNKG